MTGLPSTRFIGVCPAGWKAAGATMAAATTVYRAVLTSNCHRLGTPIASGPARGVQARMNVSPAIIQHARPADAIAAVAERTGPLSPGSSLAHSASTATAIPTANQVRYLGRVESSQSPAVVG